MTFFLSKLALEAIEQQALAGFPYEICGFVGGAVIGQGREVQPARNLASSPQVEYNISPEETLAVLLDFEQRGLKISGVYHSHPRYPARPSGTDLALADLPGVCYLITSVTDAAAGQLKCETRAWRIERRKAHPEQLVIIE